METALAPVERVKQVGLAKALVAAQVDLKNPAFDKANSAFGAPRGYASLAAHVDALRMPLAKHGLAVVQLVGTDPDGRLSLRTLLLHASGESLESHVSVPMPTTEQKVGSALTYLRRYALAAIVGVCGDEDDDGNVASAPTRRQEAPVAPNRLPAPKTAPTPQKASGAMRQVSGVCAGVEAKESKAGKAYWRIGLEAGDGVEWFTTFKKQTEDALKGKRIDLTIEDRERGPVVVDVWESEEVPF